MDVRDHLVRPANGVSIKDERDQRKQQIAAALSVIALGMCAVVFIISNVSGSADLRGPQDSILNILTPTERAALAVAAARETSLVMGPGQEATDAQAVKAAWATFKDSKDEEVLKALKSWDPKEMESDPKVEEAITDMKALGLETEAENKILKKFLKPE